MNSVVIGEWVLRSLWQGGAVAAALVVVLAVLRRPEHRHGASVAALLVLAIWPLFGAAEVGIGAPVAGPEVWLGRAWMFGAGFAAVRLAVGHLRVRRLRSRSIAAPPGLQARFDALKADLAPWAGLGLSADAVVPLAIGVLKPMVLMPPALLLRLDPDQIEALIAHELAHLQRLDPLIAVVQGLVEAAYFFHPAAWWISAQIRRESEHCADRVAAGRCGDPVRYARALTALAESRASLPVPAADGGPLMDRIRTLLDPTHRRPRSALVILLMFGLVSMAWAGGDADAEVPSDPAVQTYGPSVDYGRLEARRQALEAGRVELEDARAEVLEQRDALRGEGRSLETRRAQLEARAAQLTSQAAQLEARQEALSGAEERIAEARTTMEATGAERWSAPPKPAPKPRRARMSARPPVAPLPPGFAVPPLDVSVPLPPLPPMPAVDASFSMVSTTVDGQQVMVQQHLVGDRAEVLRKLKAVVAELEAE